MLGQAIRQHRLDQGMQQRQLAAAIGVQPSVLSALETGARKHVGQALVARISQALGLSAEEEARLQALRKPGQNPRMIEIPPNATPEEIHALRVLVSSIGRVPALQLIGMGMAVEQSKGRAGEERSGP